MLCCCFVLLFCVVVLLFCVVVVLFCCVVVLCVVVLCVVVCCCAQPLKTLNLAWESGRGLTCSGFGVVVVVVVVVVAGLDFPGPPSAGPPLHWTPLRRTAQNFALFLPFPATVSLFLCLSGGLLVEFWWCFEGRNPEMCTFGLSGCRVKPRRPRSQVRRIFRIVRRGWKAVETPSGWYDVIRGPSPPSHQWPLATSTQWRPRQPQVQSWFSPQRRWNSGPKSQPGRGVPTKEGGNGIKLNPDEKCAAAQLKVQRLEAALAAFGDESSPEKEAIEGFLIRARIQAQVRPVEERLKSCEECLERSLKKLEEVQGEVDRTRARLARLREEAASARPVDVAPTSKRRSLVCERSSPRQKERHQRNVHASVKGSPSPEGASKRCRIQLKSCGIG